MICLRILGDNTTYLQQRVLISNYSTGSRTHRQRDEGILISVMTSQLNFIPPNYIKTWTYIVDF